VQVFIRNGCVPVMQCGIPLWIRNTFTPERPGTNYSSGPRIRGVKALTAIGCRTDHSQAGCRPDVWVVLSPHTAAFAQCAADFQSSPNDTVVVRPQLPRHVRLTPRICPGLATISTVAMVTVSAKNGAVSGIARAHFGLGRENVVLSDDRTGFRSDNIS